MSDEKPIEFWITKSRRAYDSEGDLLPSDEVRIHVIEYSAYEKLREELQKIHSIQNNYVTYTDQRLEDLRKQLAVAVEILECIPREGGDVAFQAVRAALVKLRGVKE